MNRRRKFDGHTSASGVVAALGFFCVCGGVGGDVGGARWELSCKTSCTTVFGTVLNIFTVQGDPKIVYVPRFSNPKINPRR